MKTLLEQRLIKMGIQTRDDDGNLRPEEELTEDVMAYLDKCDEEYASQILFEISLAGAIERAAERIEKRRH